VLGRRPRRTDIAKDAAIEEPYIDVGCSETLRGCLGDNVECSFGCGGRAGNGTQDIGAGGLIFERLPQLVEEARILDGDDGLGGEILDQLDLLFSERPYLLTINTDYTDQFISLEHWHRDDRLKATKLCAGNHKRIAPNVGFSLSDIDELNDLFRHGCAAKSGIGARTQRRTLASLDERWRRIMKCSGMESVAIVQIERTEIGSADLRGIRQHRLEHRL
jgi:hypothetical protein